DLFEYDRRLGDAQATTAVFLRNERREPACLCECPDERLRVGRLLLDVLPIRAVETTAQFSHRLTVFTMLVEPRIAVGHWPVLLAAVAERTIKHNGRRELRPKPPYRGTHERRRSRSLRCTVRAPRPTIARELHRRRSARCPAAAGVLRLGHRRAARTLRGRYGI